MNFTEFLKIILQPSVAFIIGLLTIILGRNTSRMQLARERLEKVYHPLFLSIEPFLYKKVTFKEIGPFIEVYRTIEKEYSLLIRPSIRQHMKYICERNYLSQASKYSKAEWIIICDYISKDYDRLCRQAHIPIRSTSYRLYYEQYSSKSSMYLGIIYLNLPEIIFFTAIIAILYQLH